MPPLKEHVVEEQVDQTLEQVEQAQLAPQVAPLEHASMEEH